VKLFSKLSAIVASSALALTGLVAIATPAKAADCTGTIAIMAPLTGGAAFIGKEQSAFAQVAIDAVNAKNGSKIDFKEFDTQLDAAVASSLAPSVVSNKSIVGVVGPAGSQEVLAIGGLLGANDIALVSPSATRTNLTAGTYPSFFRPIGNDAVQAPTGARYMVQTLKAREVVVIEEKTAYGTGLANEMMAELKKLRVKATKLVVNEKNADYAAVVTRVPKTADFVYVTFQVAAKSESVAQELIKQKKKAVVFGSDGSDSPTFKTPGTFLTAFAPDVSTLPAAKAAFDAFKVKTGAAAATTFGPPAYVAAQVIAEAAVRACAAGKTGDRATVLAEIKKTNIKKSILGKAIRFTATGDVIGGTFPVFKTQKDGTRKTVG